MTVILHCQERKLGQKKINFLLDMLIDSIVVVVYSPHWGKG